MGECGSTTTPSLLTPHISHCPHATIFFYTSPLQLQISTTFIVTMSRSQIDMIFWGYYYRTTRLVTAVNNSTTQQTNSTHLTPQPAHSDSFCWVQHALCSLCQFVRDSPPTLHTKCQISLAQPRFLLQFSIPFNIHPFGIYLLSTSYSLPLNQIIVIFIFT